MNKIVIAAFATAVSASGAADISGAGATFPYPIYAAWADAYRNETGVGLNYQSIGSGAGIKQIQARTVTFGATDTPLSGADLDKSGLIQFPTVIGGIVPVVNIAGIRPGELVFDGSTLADIFLGRITRWDDAAIAKLNPQARLPSRAIAVVYRSDESGTTFNFTTFLTRVSAGWQEKVGAGSAVEWPVGSRAKGNEGVALSVKQTADSIGYVEYAHARRSNLAFGAMINRDGETVQPTAATFAAAAADADWRGTPGYGVVLANQKGAQAWPITAATFILMHRKPDDADAARDALRFFHWAYARGGRMASELGYIPLPDAVVKDVEARWVREIAGADGEGLRTGR